MSNLEIIHGHDPAAAGCQSVEIVFTDDPSVMGGQEIVVQFDVPVLEAGQPTGEILELEAIIAAIPPEAIATLQAVRTDIQQRHTEVLEMGDQVATQHADVLAAHTDIQTRHADTVVRHNDVVAKHQDVEQWHTEADGWYQAFRDGHDAFEAEYDQVRQWYDEVMAHRDNIAPQYRDMERWYHTVSFAEVDVRTRHSDVVQRAASVRQQHKELTAGLSAFDSDFSDFLAKHADTENWYNIIDQWQARISAQHEDMDRWHENTAFNQLDVQTRHTDVVAKAQEVQQRHADVVARTDQITADYNRFETQHQEILAWHGDVDQWQQQVQSLRDEVERWHENVAFNQLDVQTRHTDVVEKYNTILESATGSVEAHAARNDNPHGVTKHQLDLGNVDNTSDLDKPVSIAQQEALDQKVDKVVGKQLSTEDYTTAEKSKLAGVAAGATKNATDAQLRDRATHTGTQPIETIEGLEAALDAKVDKVAGKQLSTEDYTTAEKSKLAGVAAGATKNATDAQLRDRATHTGTQPLSTISDAGDVASINKNGNASTYLNGAGAWTTPPNTTYSVISTAEIDAGTASTARTISAQRLKYIMDKLAPVTHTHPVSAVTGLQAALDAKVDKVTGKGLSTEDYTTAEKSKLAGIAAGAQVNPPTTASRTSSSTTTVLQAKAMNDHRASGDHDGRYLQIAGGTATGHIYVNENLGFGKYFYLGDYDDTFSTTGTGLRSYVRDGTWHIGAAPGETNPVKINLSGIYAGNGSELTALNASALSSGTVPNARLPATATRWPSWSEVTSKPSTATKSQVLGGVGGNIVSGSSYHEVISWLEMGSYSTGTISLNLSNSLNFTLTVGGNVTIGNPTNAVGGKCGEIVITVSGNSVVSWGSNWKFLNKVPSIGDSGSMWVISYKVLDSSTIIASANKVAS